MDLEISDSDDDITRKQPEQTSLNEPQSPGA